MIRAFCDHAACERLVTRLAVGVCVVALAALAVLAFMGLDPHPIPKGTLQ